MSIVKIGHILAMPAIFKLSLESLAEAISSLDLAEKMQLQEIIEQQIFEDEEAIYEDDSETIRELESVKSECETGEVLTMSQYLTQRQQPQSSKP
jgi:hypothetical protein